MIDCIILAGGFGTRLKKIVPDLPKPLALINGVSFLDILIKQVSSFEKVGNVILAVGYKADQIIEKYSNVQLKKNIIFSKENSPLGTGGAIAYALRFVGSEDILVLNGDSYIDFSFNNFIEFHENKNSECSIVSKYLSNAERYGFLQVDSNDCVLRFNEKKYKSKGYINGGVYLLNKKLFTKEFHKNKFSLENDFFPKILDKKSVFAFKSNGIFIDIGTKESYQDAQNVLKNLSKK